MRKRNVINYRNNTLRELKEVREELEELNDIGEYNNSDALTDLYLQEKKLEGQIFACNYILNNC